MNVSGLIPLPDFRAWIFLVSFFVCLGFSMFLEKRITPPAGYLSNVSSILSLTSVAPFKLDLCTASLSNAGSRDSSRTTNICATFSLTPIVLIFDSISLDLSFAERGRMQVSVMNASVKMVDADFFIMRFRLRLCPTRG